MLREGQGAGGWAGKATVGFSEGVADARTKSAAMASLRDRCRYRGRCWSVGESRGSEGISEDERRLG